MEYDGNDAVVTSYASGLPPSHVGSISLKFSSHIFHLRGTLYIARIKKSLVSVHHVTKHNKFFLEFHPSYFFVKDRTTGTTLLSGECEHNVYPLPDSVAHIFPTKVAYVYECTIEAN